MSGIPVEYVDAVRQALQHALTELTPWGSAYQHVAACLELIDPPVQGPPEEIGTGLYRLADGEVVGHEPEDLSGY